MRKPCVYHEGKYDHHNKTMQLPRGNHAIAIRQPCDYHKEIAWGASRNHASTTGKLYECHGTTMRRP
eukprot:2794841-Pyramimonas_sp.AAC.1